MVIEDNLCNNYCNISLNNTCGDFLYKLTSSHNKRGEKILIRDFTHNLREQQKTLNLSLLTQGSSSPFLKEKKRNPALGF